MSESSKNNPSAGAEPREWHRIQVAGIWVYTAPMGTVERLERGDVESAPEEDWKHLGMVPTDGAAVPEARAREVAHQLLYRASCIGELIVLVGRGEYFDFIPVREA